jgi:hypothetical protein
MKKPGDKKYFVLVYTDLTINLSIEVIMLVKSTGRNWGPTYTPETISLEGHRIAPMKTRLNQTTDHMTQVGTQIKQIKIPLDYSSPALLTRFNIPMEDGSAVPLKTTTHGVNITYPLYLLSSVRTAQQAL